MKLAVAQLGARMHYAVPGLLHQAGILEHFYTDGDAGRGWPRLAGRLPAALRPRGLNRLLARRIGLPEGKVTAYNHFGLRYALRRGRARSQEELHGAFLWAGESFCRKLMQEDLGGATHTFSYNSAGLEWMRHARGLGLGRIMEQTIVPKAVEEELLNLEREKHPDWEGPPGSDTLVRAFAEREQAEWEEADLILCGSEFVRQGIAKAGGPWRRCQVLPYGVDVQPLPREGRADSGPLRVLSVGAVGLRKGSATLLEVAKRVGGACVFRMAGPLTASPAALAKLAEHVQLLGPVPRSEIREHAAWADVFFLPSLCEGSATSIYEALACGLPVITTPNAGSVIEDGAQGHLLEAGDAAAMAEKLIRLSQNRGLLSSMSEAASALAAGHSTQAYAERLMHCLKTLPKAVSLP